MYEGHVCIWCWAFLFSFNLSCVEDLLFDAISAPDHKVMTFHYIYLINSRKGTFSTYSNVGSGILHKSCLHLLFPAADLHRHWGQSHCQARRCSRFRWPSQRCRDHLSDPSCLWFQTCAVYHPGCPEWWLKKTRLTRHVIIMADIFFFSSFFATFRNTHTYPVHVPTTVKPPLRYSLMVQLPIQKQTLPPGPEMTQS